MKTFLIVCAVMLLTAVSVGAETTCTEYALDLTTGLPWPAAEPWIEGIVLYRGAVQEQAAEQGGVETLAVVQLKVASAEDDRLWFYLKDLACRTATLDLPVAADDAAPVIEEIPEKHGLTWRVKHNGEWWYGR